ncbi:hypothetical protein OSB04_028961, partial [Centaurea solstitialis]
MEVSWEEALDVDDSDLHSLPLLRPCKQQRRHRDQTNPPPTAADLPLPQTLDSSPKSPSQTDNSLPQNFNDVSQYESPPPPPPLPPSRVIPGPAGIVQAAKLLKTRDNDRVRVLGQEEVMATQEYIRRVVEDPEEDADFKLTPWLSAMEFCSGDGVWNSVGSAHLGDIKGYLKNGKLDQVVAVVKSCAPNALGDLMVVLKDPTGTVSGTIHHKVVTEGEFGKGSFVGSVLVLHKVSVFSPSRSAHYLNITKRNLVKVFYKDGGSSQQQTFHGCKITDAAPSSGGHFSNKNFTHPSLQDSGQKTPMVRSSFSLERVAERTANGTKTSTTNKQNLQANPIVSIGTRNEGNEILKDTNVIGSGENERRVFDSCKQPTEGGSLSGGLKAGSEFVNDGDKHGVEGRDAVRVNVELAKANGSIPDWTDEQLNELFDGDFQDD